MYASDHLSQIYQLELLQEIKCLLDMATISPEQLI